MIQQPVHPFSLFSTAFRDSADFDVILWPFPLFTLFSSSLRPVYTFHGVTRRYTASHGVTSRSADIENSTQLNSNAVMRRHMCIAFMSMVYMITLDCTSCSHVITCYRSNTIKSVKRAFRLYHATWFRPDLLNGKTDQTTTYCEHIRQAGHLYQNLAWIFSLGTGLCMRCVGFDIQQQHLIFMVCILLWSTVVRVHASQSYSKMDVRRMRISQFLELRVIVLANQVQPCE